MAKRITLFFLLLTLMAAGLAPAVAKDGFAPKTPPSYPHFDLTLYLAPPPAQDSAQTKAEIDEILKYQRSRSPRMIEAAQADQDETGFTFADVLGPDFTADKLPLTEELLQWVHKAEGALTDPAKDHYHRPRPYVYDKRVEPCVKKSNSYSYPSGHATGGTAMAVILAHMVPEKKDALLARGLAYAENRIVGGAHYRSDVVAGERAGVLLADALLNDRKFQKEFEKARNELRNALGLK
jgi:acid phosphatase (class A)